MPAAARCRQSPAHPRHTRPACASPAQRRYLGIRQRSKAGHKFAVAFFLTRLAQLQHCIHGLLVRGCSSAMPTATPAAAHPIAGLCPCPCARLSPASGASDCPPPVKTPRGALAVRLTFAICLAGVRHAAGLLRLGVVSKRRQAGNASHSLIMASSRVAAASAALCTRYNPASLLMGRNCQSHFFGGSVFLSQC